MTLAKMAALLLTAAFIIGLTDQAAAQGRFSGQTGVMVTPKNFPNHAAQDVAESFRLGAELGSFAVIRVDWKDAGRWEAARALVDLAHKENLAPALELSAFNADELKGASIGAPKDVSDAAGGTVSFTNPAVAQAFSKAVLQLAELRPTYLAVATDVNLLQQSSPAEFDAFAALYKGLYDTIKQRSPDTKVYVSFQWDAMQGKDQGAIRRLVDAFRPKLDLFTLNSEPRKLFESGGPAAVPADYFARIGQFAPSGGPVFVQVSWPSEGKSGEADQVAFIRALPNLLASIKPAMLSWTFLHDVKVLLFFTARLGLRETGGQPKPSFAAFRELGGGKAGAVAPVAAAAPGNAMPRSAVTRASRAPAQFAVFTARKDGSDVSILISNSEQEMSHPRVSPDRTRVVLTQYTKRGKDGKATEEQGYEGTEIRILNLDGSGLETIIPAKPGIVAANGCWSPDGKSLIYISTDNPQRAPEIRQIDLATRKVMRVPTPAGLKATDPHWEAGQIVFPAKAAEGKGADALWIMRADGSGARQITRPPRSKNAPGLYGDFDPKISPDGSKVAFMRIDGGTGWRVMVLDLATNEEKLLTPSGGAMEWLPTWSSDGKLLLFVHVDTGKPREIGLYTMTPAGENRKMIALPRGYLYGHSTFFPGDGSSDSARIIFNGTPKAGL